MGVAGVAEGQQFGQRPVRQRREFGLGQRCIGTGRAAHRLGGVVDQDVQRSGGGHRIGKADHLGRVTKIDANDAESMQPVR